MYNEKRYSSNQGVRSAILVTQRSIQYVLQLNYILDRERPLEWK